MKETQPTGDGKQSFVIRGHHLPLYEPLLCENENGKIHTPQRLANIKRFRLESPDFLEFSDDIGKEKAYRKDMIGTRRRQADKLQRGYEEVFTRFLKLDDEHPVDLVEEQKDEICNTCPIKGKHCTMKDTTFYGGTNDIINGDRKYVDIFLEYTKKQSTAKIAITDDIAHFTDAPSQKVRRIRTDAETIKKFIKEV